jgi:hypothetical protein
VERRTEQNKYINVDLEAKSAALKERVTFIAVAGNYHQIKNGSKMKWNWMQKLQ